MIHSGNRSNQRCSTRKLTDHLCNKERNQPKTCNDYQCITLISCLKITDYGKCSCSTGNKCQLIPQHAKHKECNRNLYCSNPHLCISISKSRCPWSRDKRTCRRISCHDRHSKNDTVHISSANEILLLRRTFQLFFFLFAIHKAQNHIKKQISKKNG